MNWLERDRAEEQSKKMSEEAKARARQMWRDLQSPEVQEALRTTWNWYRELKLSTMLNEVINVWGGGRRLPATQKAEQYLAVTVGEGVGYD